MLEASSFMDVMFSVMNESKPSPCRLCRVLEVESLGQATRITSMKSAFQ